MAFAVPFAVGVFVMILLWTRQNRLRVSTGIGHGGGFLSRRAADRPARTLSSAVQRNLVSPSDNHANLGIHEGKGNQISGDAPWSVTVASRD